MRRYGFFLLTGLLLSFGCNEFQQAVKDAKKDIPPPPRDNYIILLDLSDRILYNNQQQVSKDLTVIKSLYGAFKSKLEAKDPTHLFYTVTDKLKILIAPQRSTPKNLYEMVGNLRVELASEQPDKRAAAINETEKNINNTLPEIYKQAVISNNSKSYSGADIWQFFNEDLENGLEKDAQNTLFIVTDGYMEFEKAEDRPAQNNRMASCTQIINTLKKFPDWQTKFDQGDYGLLPVTKKFANLKVVLLEVNPREDWNGEFSMLNKIWGKWFTEMGVTNYRLIKNYNINEVREALEKFMDVKIAGKIDPVNWTKLTQKDSSLLATSKETDMGPITNSRPVSLGLVKSENTAARPVTAKPVLHSTRDVLPPEETDADFQDGKKKDNATFKKDPARSAKDDSDILKDGTPTKGFNTGLKKNKKNH